MTFPTVMLEEIGNIVGAEDFDVGRGLVDIDTVETRQ
jgi:hypothetical protein